MATVIRSVGADPSRNFQTVAAWGAATVLSNDIEIAELYADAATGGAFTITSQLLFTSSLKTASNYRHVRPALAPGTAGVPNRYNPLTGTGVRMVCNVPAVSAQITVSEQFFKWEGTGFIAGVTTGKLISAELFANAHIIDGCTFLSGDVLVTALLQCSGAVGDTVDRHVRNCLFVGSNTNGTGSQYGLFVSNKTLRVYNNTSYGHRRSAVASEGFHADTNNTSTFKNNLSFCNRTADYNLIAGTTSANNGSGDATASGSGSLTSMVLADTFLRPQVSSDFRLRHTSLAIDAGADISGTFTTDIDGNFRVVPWEMGCYTGFQTAPSSFQVCYGTAMSITPDPVIIGVGIPRQSVQPALGAFSTPPAPPPPAVAISRTPAGQHNAAGPLKSEVNVTGPEDGQVGVAGPIAWQVTPV